MTTHAGPVKRKLEAADLQNDVTDTDKNKMARIVGPNTQGNTAQYIQHQSIHSNDASQASKHHDTELSTSIHNLSPELMAMIFSHLDCGDKVRGACVCSYWRDLIDIPSVWRDVCPIIDVDKLTSKDIEKMHTLMIRKVEICYFDNVKKMTRFLQSLPHLKSLSIYSPFSLTRVYPGKKTIWGIKQFTIYCSNLNTGVLRSFLQPMVNLQHLRLNFDLEEDVLRALQHSKHLVSLHIKCRSKVVKIVGPSVGKLNPVSSMKRLNLENVTVGDSGLDFISRAFPQLCALELTLSPGVTCDGQKKLAKLKQLKILMIRSRHFEHGWIEHLNTELPQLEDLSLSGCRSINNECLQSISKLPALRVLQVPIQNQEVEGLQALSQGCRCLQTLRLVFGNQSINQGLRVIECMRNLEYLTLYDCSVNDNFWRENSKSFNKLRELSLMSCQHVSEQCLPYLSQMVCLKKLFLQKCKTFWNESIMDLGDWGIFNALTCLQLMDLGIEDDSLVKLSKNTPILKNLIIVSCKNVTENGLAAAVKNLLQLKALATDFSAGIKDELKRIRPDLQFYQM